MNATPGACINETGLFSSAAVVPQRNLPSCVALRSLCHKVNIPS